MARTNMTATRRKPEVERLLTLQVMRREQISPSFARVTLGGGDIDAFCPMGYDQWFRLFLPVSETSLSRLPNKLDTLSYLRYLTISKTDRPVLRNYTVRAFRADGPSGPELDIDFVLHGSIDEGTSGPAASWAQTVEPGSPVAILDEGISFAVGTDAANGLMLVADETALPAVAGILSSLPRTTEGTAIIEISTADDIQDIDAPPGFDVRWAIRQDHSAVPGTAALREVVEQSAAVPSYGWVAGEQSMVAATRRRWVQAGVPKSAISFIGYWKTGSRH